MYQKSHGKFLLMALGAFFILISVLLLEINSIVFLAINNVFQVSEYQFLTIFILGIFSGGFLFMLLVERYYTSIFVRFFYLITSSWMGILCYFFITSFVYMIINFFISIPKEIGVFLFLVAVLISLYGFIHGRKITVKKVKVSLSNLKNEWKNRKIVFMSDLHLGPVNGKRFARKIVEITNSLSPDIIFIGGDLYDGSHRPDPVLIAKPLENLSAKLGKFFVTGNHEEFGDPAIFSSAVRSLGIRVLDDEMVEIDGLQIVGVDYLNTSNKKRFKETLESLNINKEKPSILLKHEPKNLKIAEQAGISFQVSGHTHNGQLWPFNYLVKIMYKGFNYGLKKYGSMFIYVSSGVGGWGPPLRVGSDYEIVEITFM